MNKLTQVTVISCISFTFSCIFYLPFSYLEIFPPFGEEALIHMLLVSLGIVILISLINLFAIQSLILLHFLQIIIVISVLFLAGIILDMYPLNWYYGGFVMVIGLLTYIFVITISFLSNQESARQINASIRAKERFIQDE